MNPAYKLHIVFHKVKERYHDDFVEKIEKFWAERIQPVSKLDLKVTFEVTNQNEVVTFKSFGKHEASGKTSFGTENGKAITRNYVDRNQYHQVVFCHQASAASNYEEVESDPNNFVNSFAFYEELYPNTEYTEVVVEGVDWAKKALLHETMHAISKKCYRAGIPDWIDHMDGTVVDGKWVHYYLNSNEYAPDGNYSRTINAIAKARCWYLLSSDKRNMYQYAKVKGEHTIVIKKNDKWLELVTPPDGWEIVKRELQIFDPIPEITREEVTNNYGGRGRFGIIFEEV